MSRFYGSIEGSARTTATRQGTDTSGIQSHTRGWNTGVEVIGRAHGTADTFAVYITGGSNAPYGKLLLTVKEPARTEIGKTLTIYNPVTGVEVLSIKIDG